MKKILFLIMICFLLTGCTVNYNLEIENNSFKETITGSVLNSEIENDRNATDINMYNYLINSPQRVFKNNDNILYNKELNQLENLIDYEYSYNFSKDNFINSRILNECFEKFSFKEEDNKYYISVSGDFKCSYTNDTYINITTEHKVNANNADSKKNNTYTWIINKDKTEDLNLFITIDKDSTNSTSTWNVFKTFGLIILVILSGICIFVMKKKEQN